MNNDNFMNQFETKTSISEDKIQEALNWIEEHKKKSKSHDKILKILSVASGISLVPAIMLFFIMLMFGNLMDMLALLVSVPVMLSGVFIYYMINKVNKSND